MRAILLLLVGLAGVYVFCLPWPANAITPTWLRPIMDAWTLLSSGVFLLRAWQEARLPA